MYTLALEVPPPNDSGVHWSNTTVSVYRTPIVCVVKNASQLADLSDEELKVLLNDDSLPLSQQIRVLDERRHRATARRKAEEMAELVATVPIMTALADSAEKVGKAQAWLDRAKWVRSKAVKSALAAGYNVRITAEVARIAPSTALRIGSEELASEPPPP